jgi:hypothetical protein
LDEIAKLDKSGSIAGDESLRFRAAVGGRISAGQIGYARAKPELVIGTRESDAIAQPAGVGSSTEFHPGMFENVSA